MAIRPRGRMSTKRKIVFIAAIAALVLVIGAVAGIVAGGLSKDRQVEDQIRAQVELIVFPDRVQPSTNAIAAAIRQHTAYEIVEINHREMSFRLQVFVPDVGGVLDSLVDPDREFVDVGEESQRIEDAIVEAINSSKVDRMGRIVGFSYTIDEKSVVLDFDRDELADVLSGGLISKYEEMLGTYETER